MEDKIAEMVDKEVPLSSTVETQKQKKVVEIVNATKLPIPIIDGIARPVSIEQEYRLADLFLKSGVVPSRFGNALQVQGAYRFALENFPKTPLAALRQIASIKGSFTMFGDLPLSKARQCPDFVSIHEFVFDREYKEIKFENKNLSQDPWGAVCKLSRRGADGQIYSNETFFTLEEAKDAGLIPAKPDAAWTKYPKIMLVYRARTECLKKMFSDYMNGIAIGEYDHGIRLVNEIIEGEVIQDTAGDLNKKYLNAKDKANQESQAS